MNFDYREAAKKNILIVAHRGVSAGNIPCILNAANEIAVAAFLKEQIHFMEIPQIIGKTMENVPYIAHPTFIDYVNTNNENYLENPLKENDNQLNSAISYFN